MPSPGFADDLDALLLEEVAQAGPEEVVVVDEEHAERTFFDALGCLERLTHLFPPHRCAPDGQFS